MQYLNVHNISESESHFLYLFRHSKCLDTLDKQCERLELRHRGNTQMLSALNYAWCIREQELYSAGAPTFKQNKTSHV
jgi:hypothetical protein